MGAVAAPIAIGASIASVGFSAQAEREKARGDAAAAQFEADRAKRAAAYGRIRADQTDAQLREELSTTLANIEAVRAAQNVSPDSPTALALAGEETRVADRERRNRVFSIQAQADEDDRTALYKQRVASDALRSGNTRALAKLVGGAGTLASNYR